MYPFIKRPQTAAVDRSVVNKNNNLRPQTGLKRKQNDIIVKKIRKSPYFLYLIKNKDRLIDALKAKPIEYEQIEKKHLFGKKTDVDSDTPIPGDSLTDRIQKLLYYKLKTNVDLMAF